MWDSLPPIQGEFVNFNDPKARSDDTFYSFRDGSDQFGYPQHSEVDSSLPTQTSNLEDSFYRDYEFLKPFDSSQMPSFTNPPTTASPPTSGSTDAAAEEEEAENAELPFFYETAQFYSQKNYIFEDPDDPWLIQQQAFAELSTCYANEPTLNPPPSHPPTTPNPSVYFNASTNETLELVDLTDAVNPSRGLVQIFSDNVTLINGTTGVNTTKAPPPRKTTTIPGTLLRCVQRIVQMRCHAAVHSNNQIGRQACEVMCDAVRQRMPKLTEFLHDCRQPLDACTQRHSVFYLNKDAYAEKPQRGAYGGGATPKVHAGTYCPGCGNM
ncbi:hypothetical protein Aperf_G00000039883 [Anoplocephala perfoliata]